MQPMRNLWNRTNTGPVFWNPNNPNHRNVRPGSLGIRETQDRNAPSRPPTQRLVEVRDAGHMGLGLFARERIPRGARILAERPLLEMPAPMPLSDDENNGFNGQPVDMTPREVKDIEDFVDHVAQKGINSNDIVAMEALQCDETEAHDEDTKVVISTYLVEKLMGKWYWDQVEQIKHFGYIDDHDAELAVWSQATVRVVARYARLHAIWHNNRIKLGDGAIMDSGVFPLASRINHSCCPNVWYDFNPHVGNVPPPAAKQMLTTHATRDIAAGEQLLVGYASLSLELRGPRTEKLAAWGVDGCVCALCTDPLVEALQRRAYGLWLAANFWLLPCPVVGGEMAELGISPCEDAFEALRMGEEVIALLTHPMWNVRERGLTDAYGFCSVICEHIATDPKLGLPYADAVGYWEEAMRFCGEQCQLSLILVGTDGRDMKRADTGLRKLRDRRETWEGVAERLATAAPVR